jgi:hypothetical protein
MPAYQPILICPLCQEQQWLTLGDAKVLISTAMHRGDRSVNCPGCGWDFSSKKNITFQRIPEREVYECHALSARIKSDTREGVREKGSV